MAAWIERLPLAVDPESISSRVKPLTLKLIFEDSLLALSIEETVWRTSWQVCLCRWEKHIEGFTHI